MVHFVHCNTGCNQGYEIIHNQIKQSVPVEQSTGIFLTFVEDFIIINLQVNKLFTFGDLWLEI